ncbi:hypothetical protein [Pedobacter agri]|uniref:hypothetical protein n=1 Tax=Pedobacter agri TaxID=454586 RepID=UPI002781711A|nr:hypothetical protein [Pedobacter agri]MDQ1142842.1 hypothetical protein [Pedobacter agri]
MGQLILQGYIGEKNKFVYMKHFILIIALHLITSNILAQETSGQMEIDLKDLLKKKIDYEKFKGNILLRDSVLTTYRDKIDQIKNNKKTFSRYINAELKQKSRDEKQNMIEYRHLSITESNSNLRQSLINRKDFYKIVKYYLFCNNDTILPKDFRGLSIIDEKDYNGYNIKNRPLWALAVKYLSTHLTLTVNQKKFIKDEINQKHVLEMKAYIDENGNKTDTIEFIMWALEYWATQPKPSLYHLDNVYDALRFQQYSPKEKN